jgi:hypothetical protein
MKKKQEADTEQKEVTSDADSSPLAVIRVLTFRGEVLYHVLLTDGRVVQMKKDELAGKAPDVYLDYLGHSQSMSPV